MKQAFHQPFSKDTFENFIKEWTDISNRSECGSIVNLAKRDQLYRVKQIQNNRSVVQKYLSNPKNTQILYLDLLTQNIEDPIDLELFLKQHIHTNKKTVLFIIDADKLIIETPAVLSYLDNLYHEKPLISILYLFQKNITLPRYSHSYTSYTTLYQNINIFPLFQRHDTEEFIIQMEERFNVSYPMAVKNKILRQCGGHLWLIKQACRHFAQTKKIEQLFTNDGMRLRLNTLFDELTPEEKKVLYKIAFEQNIESLEENQILEYFLKIRLVNKVHSTYRITVPVIHEFIINQPFKKIKVTINDQKRITVNGIIADNLFSKKEKRLLTYFLQNKNILVSREQIALASWGRENEHNYTDWALDQSIKRLRKKISQLGLNPKLIQTIKNQGFIFNF